MAGESGSADATALDFIFFDHNDLAPIFAAFGASEKVEVEQSAAIAFTEVYPG